MPKRNTLNNFEQIILDNVPVSIITIDKKGFITSANKYFNTFAETRDFRGVNVFTSPFFIRENLVDCYKKVLTEGTIFKKENVYEINSKGEDKYLSIIAVPFRNEKGEIEGIVSMAVDNTEAVLYKNKLIELNNNMEEEIKRKTLELSRTMELKSIFMADVSHEFRTSLAIMQSSLELLSSSKEKDEMDAELYNNIFTEIKRVSTALNNLSLLNSPVPNTKLTFKKFDLSKSIDLICKELRVVADQKGIKIEHENARPKLEIVGNQEEIEKLLLNLVRNAITYNKDYGWIKVWTEEVDQGVYVKVKDSGIGIPKDQFSNIFERFYRVDKSRKRNKSDSGLGLAICKYVAEMHGGSISVDSTLDEGSIFTVYLPCISK